MAKMDEEVFGPDEKLGAEVWDDEYISEKDAAAYGLWEISVRFSG